MSDKQEILILIFFAGGQFCSTPTANAGQMAQGKFCQIGQGILPSPSARQPIKTVHTSSKITCAGLCKQTPYCRSYAVTSSSAVTSKVECRLFDYVTKTGVVTSESSFYYEIK
jgi:hypothetical protein